MATEPRVAGEKEAPASQTLSRGIRILEILAAEPSLSAAALAQRLGISSRKIEENLSALKAKGRLHRVGSDRGGHWEVVVKYD